MSAVTLSLQQQMKTPTSSGYKSQRMYLTGGDKRDRRQKGNERKAERTGGQKKKDKRRRVLGHSSNQTHTNLRGSATCLLHGATGLY
jgi:hypothetical protein